MARADVRIVKAKIIAGVRPDEDIGTLKHAAFAHAAAIAFDAQTKRAARAAGPHK
jgi:hypothetical protein